MAKKDKRTELEEYKAAVKYNGKIYTINQELLKDGSPIPPPPEASTFRPVDNRVLVLPDSEQNVTKGGIIIPETAKERPMKGTVVKAGLGTYSTTGVLIHTAVKEGDRVLYGKYGGTEVILDGQTYLVMRDSDIYGIL